MDRDAVNPRRLARPVIGAIAIALAILIAGGGSASAHIERTAYWPDPRPDASVSPAAGGRVPQVRSLASALDDQAPGTTRVVCRHDSLPRRRGGHRGGARHRLSRASLPADSAPVGGGRAAAARPQPIAGGR